MTLLDGAKVLDMKGEEIKPAEKPAKAKREKPAAEENNLPVFDTQGEALKALTKATQAEESAKARRKKLTEQYADGVKQARDSFDVAVSEAEASSAKRLVLAAVRAEEAVKEMRGKAKEAREKADEACGADKGRIGKTFSALAEVKEERAEAKAKAAKSYRRAEEKRSLIVEGILALSKQLRLDL